MTFKIDDEAARSVLMAIEKADWEITELRAGERWVLIAIRDLETAYVIGEEPLQCAREFARACEVEKALIPEVEGPPAYRSGNNS